jgi:hypothetical protein
MPLFHSYIMTDWSGGNSRGGNRPDTIWIAHGGIDNDGPSTTSPPSRTEAIEFIRNLLGEVISNRGRSLVCFDFAYAYPKGFAASVQAVTGMAGTPWKDVCQFLGTSLKDDVGAPPDSKPTNRSNRFDVANQINSMVSFSTETLGPFWCAANRRHQYIPRRRPHLPFETAQGELIKAKRLTDERVKSDTPFRLFGNDSVGSQSLTGIPRLHSLRNDDRFKAMSSVWPFETGWSADDAWLSPETQIVHVEIYPSVREREPDTIKDRGQVRAMWKWARDLDRKEEP